MTRRHMVVPMTGLAWVLILASCFYITPTHSWPLAGPSPRGDHKAGSRLALDGLEAFHPFDAEDRVVFPGRSTRQRHSPEDPLEELSSLYPSWPPRHYQSAETGSQGQGRTVRGGARQPRHHHPLVQARHQVNNPWRQAKYMGYMARGRPQSHSSLWYWD
ncbi:uncharacterized protein [Procambarus clarkii]|uniref:uncharacterized protein n=1 Tax=Procambarus clarkii TaxID=6728 RepID=UPI0037439FE3